MAVHGIYPRQCTNRYHIQVDVIDAEFSTLVAKICPNPDESLKTHSRPSSPRSRQGQGHANTTASHSDYLAVERAHELFLANVVKGCFMQVEFRICTIPQSDDSFKILFCFFVRTCFP